MFNIRPLSTVVVLVVRLCVRGGVLPTCGGQLHDRIAPLRGGVWAHNTSLTPPLFIEVPVPSQEMERSYRFFLFLRF